MENDSKNLKGITHNLTPSLLVKLQGLTTDQLALAEAIVDVMISRNGSDTANETQCLQAKHEKLTFDLGYALESIRQLVTLAVSTGHKKAVAVKVAQRFLASRDVNS